MRRLLILLFSCLVLSSAFSQSFKVDTTGMSQFIDQMFDSAVNEGLIPGGIIGVIHKNEKIHAKGYGLANEDLKDSVNFNTTRFQLASVGKMITAIAVLREVEKGHLDLDTDVNEYLTEFQVDTPTDRPITLRDLLTHTAGLNERATGYLARSKAEVEPLGEHLKKRLPKVYIAPGKEVNYSNYGFGLAGLIVELSSGRPFKEYIQSEIFDVLRMSSATYELPEADQASFASGYLSNEPFTEASPLPRHVIPAGSMAASGDDLMKLTTALVKEDNKLLSAESYALLKTQHFTMSPLLTGYGLGTEIQNFNGHIGAGKAGAMPGFYSYLVYFPQYDFGMFLSINISIDDFLEHFTLQFKNRFFPAQNEKDRNYLENVSLTRFTGEYRSNRYNRNSFEDVFALFRTKTDIYETEAKDSALLLYHNGALQYYKPIDELIFQNTRLPNYYLVFGENKSGRISSFSRNEVVAGVNSPAIYEKSPWHKTVYFINEIYGIFLVIVCTFLILPLFWLTTYLIRKRKAAFLIGKTFTNTTRWPGFLFSIVAILHLFRSFMKMFRLGADIQYGIPESIMITQSLSLLLPILLLIIIYRLIKVWVKHEAMVISRIYYTLFTIACIVHVLYLHAWHFIGFNA